MDAITAEEKKVVDELRRRTIDSVTPMMLEDVALFYRFAKAREFDLVQAEAMLRKHIAWRKEMQIDTILTEYEPPEVFVEFVPTTYICFNKEGNLVRHVDPGGIDMKGLWNSAKEKDFEKFIAYLVERDKDMVIKNGQNLGKPMYILIYDFEKLTYGNAVNLKTLQFLPVCMKMFVDNFPEVIKYFFVINVPFYFKWIYAVVKPVIPKTVFPKIGVYGTDGWKDVLLKMVDADDLPMSLGGTKTDPDGNPRCETFIHYGRPVPKKYYRNKNNKRLRFATDAKVLTVKPFSKDEITFEIEKANTFLEWEIEILSRDIDFSLLFREESLGDVKQVEIIPKQRIDASEDTLKGHFKCEKIGNYKMVFDNSYSWFHSKEVYYKADIRAEE